MATVLGCKNHHFSIYIHSEETAQVLVAALEEAIPNVALKKDYKTLEDIVQIRNEIMETLNGEEDDD